MARRLRNSAGCCAYFTTTPRAPADPLRPEQSFIDGKAKPVDIERAPLLTLYGRSYCHLCEDMEVALLALRGEFDFELEVIDVDASPSHESRFGERIPVLTHGDTELCHYFLDRPAVRRYLSTVSGAAPGGVTS